MMMRSASLIRILTCLHKLLGGKYVQHKIQQNSITSIVSLYFFNIILFYLHYVWYSKEEASKAMVYSYKHGFSGFAAKLTKSQAIELEGTFILTNTII